MLQNNTTIVAPVSGSGGAIGLIRLSGPEAVKIASGVLDRDITSLEAGRVIFARIVAVDDIVDEVLVSFFRAPRSYTGEDTVEISCHGSSYIVSRIIALLTGNGAVMAEPGEFTLRAFLNGKLDLSQAEAVADLIMSDSAASHRIALNQMRGGYSAELGQLRDKLLQITSLLELELDFSEEDVEFADRAALRELLTQILDKISQLVSSFSFGNVIKNGVPVAIVGAPNVGKSTLLNRFAGEERAIVSSTAGTTRDFIEERVTIEGISFRFIDTAGLRETSDKVETQGIVRTIERLKRAFIVLLMVEAGDSAENILGQISALELTPEQHLIVLLNKSDSFSEENTLRFLSGKGYRAIGISAATGLNFGKLREVLVSVMLLAGNIDSDSVVVSNMRHQQALTAAKEAIEQALSAMGNNLPSDLISEDIRSVLYNLGTITGEITTDDILGNIFSKFCIGK